MIFNPKDQCIYLRSDSFTFKYDTRYRKWTKIGAEIDGYPYVHDTCLFLDGAFMYSFLIPYDDREYKDYMDSIDMFRLNID